ncbi:MAG: hypothetical protein V7707_17335 [Motiliproteus sp.]
MFHSIAQLNEILKFNDSLNLCGRVAFDFCDLAADKKKGVHQNNQLAPFQTINRHSARAVKEVGTDAAIGVGYEQPAATGGGRY